MAPVSKFSFVNFDHLKTVKRVSEPEPISPFDLETLLKARDAPTNQYNPGNGMIDPATINNNGIFALFGLLGAGLVLSSIWFFFWAKNGGFRFRKGDWEDYKSTVLRRKGPNGTTLSGATKSTKLGDGSVVGSQGSMSEFGDPEKAESGGKGGRKGDKKRSKQVKNSRDEDVRAYRHEKVAKVGGLNREADGSYHDTTNSAMSEDISSQSPVSPAQYKPTRSPSKIHRPDPARSPNPGHRNFSYNPGSESRFSLASDDSHKPLRASHNHHTHRRSNNSTPNGHSQRPSRQPSPIKHASHNRYSSRLSGNGSGGYTEPLDFDSRYEATSVGESEQVRNTKAYHHPIPGLSKGPTAANAGFRRAGMGRRDSLGDSDGETEMS